MAFRLAAAAGALALLAQASPIAAPNPSPLYTGYVEYVIDSQGDAPSEANSPYVGATEVHAGQSKRPLLLPPKCSSGSACMLTMLTRSRLDLHENAHNRHLIHDWR